MMDYLKKQLLALTSAKSYRLFMFYTFFNFEKCIKNLVEKLYKSKLIELPNQLCC
jgi:hypothetical protein